MEIDEIQSRLSNLLVGTTILSMKLAGAELELFFTGVRASNSGVASIDTDAWIFMGELASIDSGKIVDDAFFECREDAIVGLYRLTGYDVEAVQVDLNGILQLTVGGNIITVYPDPASGSSYYEGDFWNVIIESNQKHISYVSFHSGHGFIARNGP